MSCVCEFLSLYLIICPLQHEFQLKSEESKNIMGDKSPKANQKKSSQKTTKVTKVAAKKTAAVVAKQAAGKKK